MSATQYSERIPAEEDPELITASDGESPQKWSSMRPSVAVLGTICLALALTMCVAKVGAWGAASISEAAPANSARALLESPEMAETMKGNYVRIRPELKAKEEQLAKKVQRGMKRITKHIHETDPKVFEQLNQLELSEEQQHGILKVVSNLADDRMQKVGREVARLAKESKLAGKNAFSQETLKRKLGLSLEQNKTKLVQLRNEFFPARSLVDKNWEVTYDADKMSLIRNSRDSWDVELDMDKPISRRLTDNSDNWGSDSSNSGSDISQTNPGSELTDDSFDGMGTKFEEGLGVLAGMLEQARVALNQIDFVGESFDIDMKIPYWAKSLVGGLDFVSELSDCVMRGESNQVKLMMCPIKYASAATDFLESVDNVLGLNNGHFFAGGPSTTQPMYINYAQQPAQQQQGQYAPQGSNGLWNR